MCAEQKRYALKWDITVIQEGSSFIGARELEKKCHNLSPENKKGMGMQIFASSCPVKSLSFYAF